MTITIPPEALEASARAIYDDGPPMVDEFDDPRSWDELDATERESYIDEARAAFLAMIEAWPNGGLHVPAGVLEPRKSFTLPAIILPLTEKPDDKA